MNFEYSPGLLGYGAKGSDGSLGMQGLAIYFTDLDPLSDLLKIESAIENNEVLWAKAEPGTKLPGGRVYITGDLFVTSRGYIYEIDAEDDEFNSTGALLSKSGFFATDGVKTVIEAFQRYFNIHNSSGGILIDNNKSSKSDYLIPPDLYGVNLQNFTRIEYTDSSAFSLYSLAETVTDEHKALGLVGSEGIFQIGNIQGNVRNTSLIFDVSLLQKTDSEFSPNTPLNTVLTNNEKSVNGLFDPNFNTNPASFQFLCAGEHSTVRWDLRDFTSEPDVKGTFVFAQEKPVGINSFVINASIFHPMIFPNLDVSGSFILSDLSVGTYYKYYMILEKNGWERESMLFTKIQTGDPAYMLILDPVSKTLNADYLGAFSPADPCTSYGSYKYGVDLSTNSLTGWNVNAGYPSWVDVSKGQGYVPGQYTFDVSLRRNTDEYARNTSLTISSEATNEVITINQGFYETTASFDTNGYLVFSTPLADQSLTVVFDLYIKTCAEGTSANHRRSRKWIQIIKNGSMLTEVYSGEADGGSSHVIRDNSTGTYGYSFTMTSSDTIQIKFYNQYRDGGDSWSTKAEGLDWVYGTNFWGSWHRFGGGWARIKSITKAGGNAGKFNINSSAKCYYKKRDTTSGAYFTGVQANPPIINS